MVVNVIPSLFFNSKASLPQPLTNLFHGWIVVIAAFIFTFTAAYSRFPVDDREALGESGLVVMLDSRRVSNLNGEISVA